MTTTDQKMLKKLDVAVEALTEIVDSMRRPILDDPLFTVEQVAEELGVSVRTIRNLIQTRKLSHVKLGEGDKTPVRIAQSAINDYLRTVDTQ